MSWRHQDGTDNDYEEYYEFSAEHAVASPWVLFYAILNVCSRDPRQQASVRGLSGSLSHREQGLRGGVLCSQETVFHLVKLVEGAQTIGRARRKHGSSSESSFPTKGRGAREGRYYGIMMA